MSSKLEIVIVVISLIITILISCVLAFVCWTIFNINFFTAFIAFIALQFVFFLLWGSTQQRKDIREFIEFTKAEKDASQTLTIECAYCGALNRVPIKLNERNVFACQNCKQKNAIQMSFIAAQITTPLQPSVSSDKEDL